MVFQDAPVVETCMFPQASLLLGLFNDSGNPNVNETCFSIALALHEV